MGESVTETDRLDDAHNVVTESNRYGILALFCITF